MESSYQITTGTLGLLISMPHNGQAIPNAIRQTMAPCANDVSDTDWNMDTLYDFAQSMGASIISPHYSRYVIDLNRNPHGEALYAGADNTELCPTTTFNHEALYLANHQPSPEEVAARVTQYWQPYHQAVAHTLAQLKRQYSKVVLLDAHSIKSQVPRFFSGTLPDFNFGSANGSSCDPALISRIQQLELTPYSSVINGRFKGGYITRAYGDPANNIHALQLELSQRTYMDEDQTCYNEYKAELVKQKLRSMVQCLIDFSQENNEVSR